MQGRLEQDMKLKEVVDRLLKDQPQILTSYMDSLSENTWRTKKTYLDHVIIFFRWLKEKKNTSVIDIPLLESLLPLDINSYMADMRYKKDESGNIKEISSSRRAGSWSALNSFFDFLYQNELVKQNIVAKTKRPKDRSEASHDYLTQTQMKRLIHKVETAKHLSPLKKMMRPRDELLIKVFLTTGIRAEPLREINVEDIDFENKTVITINKGNKTKVFKLVDSVMESLNEWLKVRAGIMGQSEDRQTGALFISAQKTRLSYVAINDVVKFYTELIGIEGGYSCHKLRHSYGTAIYNMTKDIDYTKDALGHSSITTTQRYINEIDKDLDKVVEDKFSKIIS